VQAQQLALDQQVVELVHPFDEGRDLGRERVER
jgi:hypothetical protein